MQILTQKSTFSNSCAHTPINTTKPQAEAPDLVVDRFDFSPAFPKAGDRVYLDVKVKNTGNSPASGFHVSVDGTALPLTEQKVKVLEPQSEKTLRFGPVKMNPGSYSYTATADNRQEVVESEEGNNWTYTWINVEDPFPPRDPGPPRNPWPRP
jgi:hypothetical protein